jgi:hypothetical protein
MIPPSGREHYSVHSWKAGPNCGKLLDSGGARAPLELGGSEKGQSRTSAYRILVDGHDGH